MNLKISSFSADLDPSTIITLASHLSSYTSRSFNITNDTTNNPHYVYPVELMIRQGRLAAASQGMMLGILGERGEAGREGGKVQGEGEEDGFDDMPSGKSKMCLSVHIDCFCGELIELFQRSRLAFARSWTLISHAPSNRRPCTESTFHERLLIPSSCSTGPGGISTIQAWSGGLGRGRRLGERLWHGVRTYDRSRYGFSPSCMPVCMNAIR